MKLADIEKAQETAEGLAAAAEAARTQHQAALNSQEEDLAKREADLEPNSVPRTRRWRSLPRSGPKSWSRGTKRHSMPRLWFTPAR